MKKLFVLCLFLSAPLFAQQKGITLTGRQYVLREDSFTDRPYGEDDISYGAYLDMFDGIGGWRIGASYATGLSGPGEADSVITPEITLLGAEGVWESGFSVMMDYIDDETGTDWSDIYYQFQLGLSIPVGGTFQLGIHGYFPVSDMGDFLDISFSEIDYGVSLRAKF